MHYLGVLPPDFPKAGMFRKPPVEEAMVELSSAGVRNDCGCLVRTEVPPMPKAIPFEPIELNLDKFERWFKFGYYASSAFNTCEHHPIPAISGPDLVIKHKDGVEPEPEYCYFPKQFL